MFFFACLFPIHQLQSCPNNPDLHKEITKKMKEKQNSDREKKKESLSKAIEAQKKLLSGMNEAVAKGRKQEALRIKAMNAEEESRKQKAAAEAEKKQMVEASRREQEIAQIAAKAFYNTSASTSTSTSAVPVPDQGPSPPHPLPQSQPINIAVALSMAGSAAAAAFLKQKLPGVDTNLQAETKKLASLQNELEQLRLLDDDTEDLLIPEEKELPIYGAGVQKHRIHGGNKVPRLFTNDQEEQLCELVRLMDRRGFPMTEIELRQLAFQFGADRETRRPEVFANPNKTLLGKKWAAGFYRRHPDISKKKSTQISIYRAQCTRQVVVSTWYQLIKGVMVQYDLLDRPQQIWNFDETGLTNLQRMSKVLGVKNETTYQVCSQERGKLTTILALVNAAGVVVPPMVIFNGKRVQPTWKEATPDNVAIRCTPKGYINTETFYDYMKIFVHFLDTTGRLKHRNILLLDSHSSHVYNIKFLNMMRDNRIEVYAFHPHTTHAVQPLDSHPFKALKAEMHSSLREWNRLHCGQQISKKGFLELLFPAWRKSMNVTTIQAGFRDTGIFPFNPDAVNYKKYFPDGSEDVSQLTAERSSESTILLKNCFLWTLCLYLVFFSVLSFIARITIFVFFEKLLGHSLIKN